MWYVDFAWKMRLNGKKISRGCAPDPLTPGQARGVPEGGCRADVWQKNEPSERTALGKEEETKNPRTEGFRGGSNRGRAAQKADA